MYRAKIIKEVNIMRKSNVSVAIGGAILIGTMLLESKAVEDFREKVPYANPKNITIEMEQSTKAISDTLKSEETQKLLKTAIDGLSQFNSAK